MTNEETLTGVIYPSYQKYHSQKCFIGLTHGTSWHQTVVDVCNELLPNSYGLEPWYAEDHFDPTTPLRDKVVEMIAKATYGIYDLSYWSINGTDRWEMPRNVMIELGMAIALNRPMLILRHAFNRLHNVALPTSLQGIDVPICEFAGGKKTLRDALATNLPQWMHRSPEQEWWNRYCLFGGFVCNQRIAHPFSPNFLIEKLVCHIADGDDFDKADFRDAVERTLEHFNDITWKYLDDYTLYKGCKFLLCSHCQTVRTSPFAIYRLTPHTSADTFIAIGMDIALETQFGYKIPKILLTKDLRYIPSLLNGYEVVVTRTEEEMCNRLKQFLPQVIQRVRQTTWKPQTLPFEVFLPTQYEDEQDLADLNAINARQQISSYNVSLVYHRRDFQWALWIAWHLEQAGYSVAPLKDMSQLKGTTTDAMIETASRQSDQILLVLSQNFLNQKGIEPDLNSIFQYGINVSQRKLMAVQIHTFSNRKVKPFVSSKSYIANLAGLEEQAAMEKLFTLLGNDRLVGTQAKRSQSAPSFPRPSESKIISSSSIRKDTNANLFYVGDKDFEEQVLKSHLPVIVCFWADWSGPCKSLAPTFERLSTQYNDRLRFAKLDIEENTHIPGRLGVQGIPTLIVFEKGAEIGRLIGSSSSQLEGAIEGILAHKKNIKYGGILSPPPPYSEG